MKSNSAEWLRPGLLRGSVNVAPREEKFACVWRRSEGPKAWKAWGVLDCKQNSSCFGVCVCLCVLACVCVIYSRRLKAPSRALSAPLFSFWPPHSFSLFHSYSVSLSLLCVQLQCFSFFLFNVLIMFLVSTLGTGESLGEGGESAEEKKGPSLFFFLSLQPFSHMNFVQCPENHCMEFPFVVSNRLWGFLACGYQVT